MLTGAPQETHSKGGVSQAGYLPLSERCPSWSQQGGHYFFRLCSLSLSRKASNAITKLPKAISKPIIPININMISASVIGATSPPMYSGRPVIKLGRLPPLSWVPYWTTFHIFQSDSLFVEYMESGPKSISKQSHEEKRKTGKCRFYALFNPNIRYSNSTFPN